jgi:hypothetical protein
MRAVIISLNPREHFMEPISSLLVFFGAATLLISWVYMIIISFKTDYAWGFMSLFLPPLSYLYGLFNLGKTWEVIGLAALGSGLLLAGLV